MEIREVSVKFLNKSQLVVYIPHDEHVLLLNRFGNDEAIRSKIIDDYRQGRIKIDPKCCGMIFTMSAVEQLIGGKENV